MNGPPAMHMGEPCLSLPSTLRAAAARRPARPLPRVLLRRAAVLDPEDPVFFSTCFQKQSSWQFVGNPACPACEDRTPTDLRWKFGERCVSCAAAEHHAYISTYNATVAPWWELAETCENCDRRWS